jgi:hypothetical protein
VALSENATREDDDAGEDQKRINRGESSASHGTSRCVRKEHYGEVAAIIPCGKSCGRRVGRALLGRERQDIACDVRERR